MVNQKCEDMKNDVNMEDSSVEGSRLREDDKGIEEGDMDVGDSCLRRNDGLSGRIDGMGGRIDKGVEERNMDPRLREDDESIFKDDKGIDEGFEINFKQKDKYYQQRINDFMQDFLQTNYAQSTKLVNALSYSLMSGGKRIRPLLSYATAEALGVDLNQADYVAASVEMIHAYSLIHDDLPAMDDDDIRRGKATCHVEFDDATAILAGDALQAMAFEALSQIKADAVIVVKLIKMLSYSCGALGMAGGQSLDLESENMQLDKKSMDHIHLLKTGALIAASVEMVGLLSPNNNDKINQSLKQYGYNFGMAFQIIDDVLDVIGDEATIGKPVGSDESNNKSTYPSIMGLESSKNAATSHSKNAADQLAHLPNDSSYLKYLAEYLISRKS